MKTMAIIGYIVAIATLVAGFVMADNTELPLRGFSAVIVGAVLACLISLASTILLCVTQIRNDARSAG